MSEHDRRHPDQSSDAASETAGNDPHDSPAARFDALYGAHAGPLIQQALVLTGRARLARRAVQRAFRTAWQRWPEVAAAPDPVGWVRAAAHDYALAPWRRPLPGCGRPNAPGRARPRRRRPPRRTMRCWWRCGRCPFRTAGRCCCTTGSGWGCTRPRWKWRRARRRRPGG
ncbi:hypothetical protein O1L55_21800 [Streptomyces albulus]|nr:hypothetical protein [Streptomyces noursei]